MVSRGLQTAIALAMLAGLSILPSRPALAQGLQAQIQTQRGCGANAVYAVGDVLTVVYEIDGASQVQATIDGVFPNGTAVHLFQGTVPGNQQIVQDIAVIGGTLGTRSVRLTASTIGGRLTAQATCSFSVAGASLKAQIATDRGCAENGDHPLYTVGDQAQLLFRIDGAPQAQAVIQEIAPDGQTQVLLNQTVTGNQPLSLPYTVQGAVGTHRVRLTATATSGGTAQAECSFTVQSAPLHVQRLLAVGDPVPAASRLGMFNTDPLDQDNNVSDIRRAADDGSAYVADYAGSALLRVGIGAQIAAVRHAAPPLSPPLQVADASSQILLDTTSADPVDGSGLARILRVETGRDGTSAILALRADNNRGIYRLSNGTLTRLALLPGPTGAAELAVGDAGQIAYVAPNSAGALVLAQVQSGAGTTAPRPIALLQQGQPVLNGATIQQFTGLTSNGAGDLAVRAILRQPDGSPAQALIRKTSQGLFLLAATGQRVLRGQGASAGVLLDMRQPRIGPDGTVVFLGTGDGFANFYVQGPNRPLQPLLPGGNWNTADSSYDYEIAADGSVVLRGTPAQAGASLLYLARPNGAVVPVLPGGRLLPVGHPIFGPDGTGNLLFFLAQNPDRPLDRNARLPVALCRSRLVNGSAVVDTLAAPGQPVPGMLGAQLLSITQRPVVSAHAVVFGALFGGNVNFPVPGAGLFRLPLGGTLADATLMAEESSDLPGAGRVAILRSLAYTKDGTLLFGGLLPGAGSIVASVAPPASPSIASAAHTAAVAHTASVARIQATGPAVAPLLAIGQPLDRPDRKLLAVLGRFVALGSDRQLLVARFSEADGSVGEGLFTVARSGLIQAVAVTGDLAPGPAGMRFAAFSDTAAFTLNPPSVSSDGSVVFKAKLDESGTPTFGLFQWTGTTLANVGLANPNPDNLALTPADLPPYSFDRWSAGPGGSAYLMERHQTATTGLVTRLFEHFSSVLAPLVVPGLTLVTGTTPGPLTDMQDYVLDGTGNVFVQGTSAAVPGVLSVGAAGLAPVVRQGQALPAPADGTDVRGLLFGSHFTLMPDSQNGVLLFRASVARQGAAETGQQGLFRLGPQGVETLMVESLAVGGSRDLTFGTLATSPDRQTLNGTTAFATFGSGRWSIFRWRAGKTTLVAQEGGALPGGGKIVSLDPGPLLDLPAGSGPIFTLNEAGDVAFFATDGTRWGLYLFSDAAP